MKIFVPKELAEDETRVPVLPETIARLQKLGAETTVESGLGEPLHRPDSDYENAGAIIARDRTAALAEAGLILRLQKPPLAEIAGLRPGSIHISYLDPFNEPELVRALAAAGVSAISMEMIPRSTIAQKMDALSSQANLAGYMAVIIAARESGRIFPMMMTPSGTIQPARVFVIGVGVAGLQAIATAKRLGARVEAFDTRPVVEEQVKSLGAKFVKADLGETGQTEQGYAKALTDEQVARQREVMAKHCASADVVVTTAQLFGRPAPRIITTEMVHAMKPGSVIVDLAVESGGNVECSRAGEIVDERGVKIIGLRNLPGLAPVPASEMYSNNLGNLLEHFWDRDARAFRLKPDDGLMKGCLITHNGEIVNDTIKKHLDTQPS